MLKYGNPMARQTGWYEIMRRTIKGTFKTREIAFWERKFDQSYGEWTYKNGNIRPIDEALKDDLVLCEAGEKL